MANQVSVPELTSTSAISWDSVPVADVVTFKTGAIHGVEFRKLFNCSQRLLGRGSGQIDGDVEISLYASPKSCITLAVGAVPSTTNNTYAPTTVDQVLATPACPPLRVSQYQASMTQTTTWLPGITNTLVGENTITLAGGPPHFYFYAETDKSTAVDVFVLLRYKLRLSGYGYLKPF
jgi:hypothetical protein